MVERIAVPSLSPVDEELAHNSLLDVAVYVHPLPVRLQMVQAITNQLGTRHGAAPRVVSAFRQVKPVSTSTAGHARLFATFSIQ